MFLTDVVQHSTIHRESLYGGGGGGGGPKEKKQWVESGTILN